MVNYRTGILASFGLQSPNKILIITFRSNLNSTKATNGLLPKRFTLSVFPWWFRWQTRLFFVIRWFVREDDLAQFKMERSLRRVALTGNPGIGNLGSISGRYCCGPCAVTSLVNWQVNVKAATSFPRITRMSLILPRSHTVRYVANIRYVAGQQKYAMYSSWTRTLLLYTY